MDHLNSSAVEIKIRDFLTQELMKEKGTLAALHEELDIDSVEQVESRVFLEEEFKADLQKVSIPLNTIQNLITIALSV